MQRCYFLIILQRIMTEAMSIGARKRKDWRATEKNLQNQGILHRVKKKKKKSEYMKR